MNFSRGEIIVRDDAKYPEDALVFHGLDDQGCLRACPLGGGMEFIIPASDVSRFSRVAMEERIPIFRLSRFSLEGLDGVTFAGWTDGRSWNGWARPWFEFSEAARLAGHLAGQLRHDAVRDAFVGFSGNPEEDEVWPAEMIELADGGSVKVYPVGAGSWMWDECETEGAEGRAS
jgi:hypothetical protein